MGGCQLATYTDDAMSSQDERNSLLDLSRECKKALSNLDSTSIDAALLATHQITGVQSDDKFDNNFFGS